jgi:ABC-2 type transport system permease protein
MLRGASFLELWPEALALAVFAAAMLTLAVVRFRKSLD